VIFRYATLYDYFLYFINLYSHNNHNLNNNLNIQNTDVSINASEYTSDLKFDNGLIYSFIKRNILYQRKRYNVRELKREIKK